MISVAACTSAAFVTLAPCSALIAYRKMLLRTVSLLTLGIYGAKSRQTVYVYLCLFYSSGKKCLKNCVLVDKAFSLAGNCL